MNIDARKRSRVSKRKDSPATDKIRMSEMTVAVPESVRERLLQKAAELGSRPEELASIYLWRAVLEI